MTFARHGNVRWREKSMGGVIQHRREEDDEWQTKRQFPENTARWKNASDSHLATASESASENALKIEESSQRRKECRVLRVSTNSFRLLVSAKELLKIERNDDLREDAESQRQVRLPCSQTMQKEHL